jgi:hypothetical protein
LRYEKAPAGYLTGAFNLENNNLYINILKK